MPSCLLDKETLTLVDSGEIRVQEIYTKSKVSSIFVDSRCRLPRPFGIAFYLRGGGWGTV